MYEMEKYVSIFKNNCKPGKVYERQELEELLSEHNLNFNITAFTYNQWNKGMTSINPLFEKTGRGLYKYLGDAEESNYSGKVMHEPQGDKNVYHIANWENGDLTFLKGHTTFRDWKESADIVELIVQIGSVIEVKYAGEKRTWSIDIDTQHSQKINSDSPLGQAVLGLKAGDSFRINGNEGEVLSIRSNSEKQE